MRLLIVVIAIVMFGCSESSEPEFPNHCYFNNEHIACESFDPFDFNYVMGDVIYSEPGGRHIIRKSNCTGVCHEFELNVYNQETYDLYLKMDLRLALIDSIIEINSSGHLNFNLNPNTPNECGWFYYGGTVDFVDNNGDTLYSNYTKYCKPDFPLIWKFPMDSTKLEFYMEVME